MATVCVGLGCQLGIVDCIKGHGKVKRALSRLIPRVQAVGSAKSR